ncbi:MAG: LptA/OstA family protein [Chthonomonadales bacterium]
MLNERRWIVIAFVLLCLACASAQTQAGRAARRAGRAVSRRQQQANKPASFTYGDVTLSGFARITGRLGVIAEAVGPGTTVDLVDQAHKATARLQAEKITVYWTQGSTQAQRIEASGSVRYSGVQPAPGGEQKVRGEGSRAVFVRAENKITLYGPATFYAEQPVPDTHTVQTVAGTSNEVIYDAAKQVLTFNGNVNATITMPDTLEGPARISGAESIALELAERPYTFNVKLGSVQFSPKQAQPKPK